MSDIYLHSGRLYTLRLKYTCFYDGFQYSIAPSKIQVLDLQDVLTIMTQSQTPGLHKWKIMLAGFHRAREQAGQ